MLMVESRRDFTRILDRREVESYLGGLGLCLDDWNRVRDANPSTERRDAVELSPPAPALELHVFAQHVAGWLPSSRRKLIQIDNSSAISADEAALLNLILCGDYFGGPSTDAKSILIDSSDGGSQADFLLAHAIFLLVMFEQHAFIVSSESKDGEVIAVQDGAVILSSRTQVRLGVWLGDSRRDPLELPSWVRRLNALAEN